MSDHSPGVPYPLLTADILARRYDLPTDDPAIRPLLISPSVPSETAPSPPSTTRCAGSMTNRSATPSWTARLPHAVLSFEVTICTVLAANNCTLATAVQRSAAEPGPGSLKLRSALTPDFAA